MGLLGSIFSFKKKKQRGRLARRATKRKKERLATIGRLSKIEQSFRRGSLADTLFDRGLEDSALGGRLLEQNALRDSEESQAIRIAKDTLDLERLDQKIQKIQENAEVADAVIGVVGGLLAGIGGGEPVPSPKVGAGLSAGVRGLAGQQIGGGIAGVAAAPAALEERGGFTGQRAGIRGAPGIAATSAAGAGFETGRTQATILQPREGGFRMGTILGF